MLTRTVFRRPSRTGYQKHPWWPLSTTTRGVANPTISSVIARYKFSWHHPERRKLNSNMDEATRSQHSLYHRLVANEVTAFATNLWSPEELYLTGLALTFLLLTLKSQLIHFFRIFLHPRDITFKLLRESTSYFGYDPRRCFDASHSADRLRTRVSELKEQSNAIANGTTDVERERRSARTSATTVSHSVFQKFPSR